MRTHGGLDYRPDIDGLRAVAIAAVVVFHAFPAAARGGFTGVDVFFVISGYLISRIIWRGLAERSFTLAWFYGRRALRLFPALVLVLVATLVAGRWLFLPDAYGTLGKDVASAAAFASNLVLWQDAGYFTENAALRPLTHLWSLAVEEQFYLVFPLLLIAAHRSWRLTGALLALLAARVLHLERRHRLDRPGGRVLPAAVALLGARARRAARLRPAEQRRCRRATAAQRDRVRRPRPARPRLLRPDRRRASSPAGGRSRPRSPPCC